MKQKHTPTVGEELYTYTPCNSYYVRICHDPWTVASVNKTGNEIVVRAARLVFNGPRYYDSIPDDIVDDPNGKTMKMRWSEKKHRWQESPAGSYPRVAVFGCGYDYMPYLD